MHRLKDVINCTGDNAQICIELWNTFLCTFLFFFIIVAAGCCGVVKICIFFYYLFNLTIQ